MTPNILNELIHELITLHIYELIQIKKEEKFWPPPGFKPQPL